MHNFFLLIFQVLALVAVRKLMDRIFTKHELEILDDLMPESIKKKIEEGEEVDDESQVGWVVIRGTCHQLPSAVLPPFTFYVSILNVYRQIEYLYIVPKNNNFEIDW